MNDNDFLTLLMRHQDGTLPAEDLTAMEHAMRSDAGKRQLFADTQVRSMALHDRFRQEAFRIEPAPIKRITWITRPIASMAAGLVIGLFSASIVWAISTPRATTERLFSLLNGGFDEMHLDSGFPRQTGLWSGDEAAIANGNLRFVAPGSDSNDPSARAISCDIFQLVDLRPLRAQFSAEGESMLELSANFRDARPHDTQPSVTCFCQLYTFSGDSTLQHQNWPQNISEALSSGSGQLTTLGSQTESWQTITAKCLVPVNADFAVIQIAARPNLRPAKLDGLFADDVRLTLKTQPTLPVRVVKR